MMAPNRSSRLTLFKKIGHFENLWKRLGSSKMSQTLYDWKFHVYGMEIFSIFKKTNYVPLYFISFNVYFFSKGKYRFLHYFKANSTSAITFYNHLFLWQCPQINTIRIKITVIHQTLFNIKKIGYISLN